MKLKLMAISMLVIAGCSKMQEEAQLQETSTVDSLLQVVEEHRYAVALLSQVGMYMDSIDENRKLIAIDLETGVTEEDYIKRMKSLNEYTKKAEWTIAELEKSRGAYATQVKRLKKQILELGDQIAMLQMSVEEYKSKNANLEDEVKLTREQLLDTQVALNYNENSLDEAQDKVAELDEKLTLSEAETFYAKGEGLELMASRIEFAPKRKKQTLEQSLSHYQEAIKLGYVPAKARAESIQKLLK